jgi:hypothetical protein
VGITASFSLIDGSLGAPETIGNIALKTSADGSSAEAILMPSSDLSDKTLIFIVGEDSYTIPLKTISNISSFDKSTKYNFRYRASSHDRSYSKDDQYGNYRLD